MLGEATTTEIQRNEDSKGVAKLKDDAKAGGARQKLEEKLGRSVTTKKNYLKENEGKKKLSCS